MTSLLSVEVVAPTPGKYVQAILNPRGSRHRAEGWSKTKNNHCNQCLDTKKIKMFNEQIRPAAFSLRRLGVAQKKHYFLSSTCTEDCLEKKKMFCLSMAKKTLGNCSYSPVSPGTVVTAGSRPLHGRCKDLRNERFLRPGSKTSRPPLRRHLLA